MNLEQMLKLADEIVFNKTGQHLSTLQDAVVRGTIQRKTFKQIATDFDCSESHVRQIGSQLWEIFSEELGEEVNKSNFLSAIKRKRSQISNLLNFAQNVSGSFNICGEGRHPPETKNTNSSNEETSLVKQPQKFQPKHKQPRTLDKVRKWYKVYSLLRHLRNIFVAFLLSYAGFLFRHGRKRRCRFGWYYVLG